ncbi:MAG: NAD-dependent epimerase/dehydratase family protein [Planctomycetota bacterium]|nr:NAD-dependent epimerase/dehydratase family protein [Planctomycetota bacterium]
MKVLVTGAAGFIGFHLCLRLLHEGFNVYGIDSLNQYYDVRLKQSRLDQLKEFEQFEFEQMDLVESELASSLFARGFDTVVHLAAQAGVRHSLKHPRDYIDANVVGFMNVLEGCRHSDVGHLIYASSSSVYGASTELPFSENGNTDHPISLYAATKKANELMAHSYSHLYQLPTTGLRFFTVYGPWGRPDMALYIFAKAITDGEPIRLFNSGNMRRSFTYVDDVVEPIFRLLKATPTPDGAWSSDAPKTASSNAPYRILNIGGGEVVELGRFVELIEQHLGKVAIKELLPMQPGDIPATSVDIAALEATTEFIPQVSIEEGIRRFCEWFSGYYS